MQSNTLVTTSPKIFPQSLKDNTYLKTCSPLVRILQWTVAFSQRDNKFSFSALTQSTAENADRCGECESALTEQQLKAE